MKAEVLKINTETKLDDCRRQLIDFLDTRSTSNAPPTSSGDDMTRKLMAFIEKAENLERQQSFLKGFMFDSMKRRQDMIKKAHKETLDWIFTSPDAGFKNGWNSRVVVSTG